MLTKKQKKNIEKANKIHNNFFDYSLIDKSSNRYNLWRAI